MISLKWTRGVGQPEYRQWNLYENARFWSAITLRCCGKLIGASFGVTRFENIRSKNSTKYPCRRRVLTIFSGGVWRTRWNGRHVLVPCMYENAQMIKVDEDFKLSQIWKSTCHESITYGGCWLPERKFFCTSSFYDKKIASWKFVL